MLDLLKKYDFKYLWQIDNSMVTLNTINIFTNDFRNNCPLPHRNRLIDAEAGNPIYLFGRSSGNGYTEFIDLAGDTNDIQNMINENGVTIVYTHAHIGYYDTVGDDYVLKDGADGVFAWLEQKQDNGTLWIDTASNILDWMLDNENVVITAQSGNSFTVKNNNSNTISGITLKDLNNNIQYAKIGDDYQIYVDGSYVVLPKFTAGEIKSINITTGSYNTSLPRLTSVTVHLDVLKAEYEQRQGS